MLRIIYSQSKSEISLPLSLIYNLFLEETPKSMWFDLVCVLNHIFTCGLVSSFYKLWSTSLKQKESFYFVFIYIYKKKRLKQKHIFHNGLSNLNEII